MPGDATGDFSELVLGLCAGALLAMAAAMLRAPRPAARWTGFAFFLASALFGIKLWCDSTHAFPMEARMVIGVLAMTSVGWFWLMVMALFCDKDEFAPVMFAAPAGLFVFGLLHQLPRGPLDPLIWTGSSLLQAGLAIAALVVVLRSWKDDLVEPRRQIRGPFMIAVSLYILSLNGFDVWDMIGETPSWYPMLNAILLAICVLAGAFAFLEARGAMFGETAEPPPLPQMPARATNGHAGHASNGKANIHPIAALDRAAKADLERLQALMTTQQVWREEGLTIASLALKAGMPEAQLRRMVSDCLGYRNFPSYVNAHRISAAKTRLSDPNEARVTVSTIAYDIGFASLGPFNRAFKEETGVSPSEWRRNSLNEPSPISESA